ncbi:MAG: hypothetical protein A2751_03845 [Candidatus Doudnabacteria bacterium RIFCSPHIGHO2_01_FULL_46_14]|uniref:Uncharacterized protein n=1 Tax=Candidatus Doudnabacteria bacterium RIFCSPHIGHO2_01_FULL_46_14 TaxID=1817824 RepID=A0A1F5NKM8_9BACT|nr:MAG: hypothetical protein A2751_03845 [Candidatus Doudnabacteria bacterium RIFCSPHIGHO2_01_FULL_46_14]
MDAKMSSLEKKVTVGFVFMGFGLGGLVGIATVVLFTNIKDLLSAILASLASAIVVSWVFTAMMVPRLKRLNLK